MNNFNDKENNYQMHNQSHNQESLNQMNSNCKYNSNLKPSNNFQQTPNIYSVKKFDDDMDEEYCVDSIMNDFNDPEVLEEAQETKKEWEESFCNQSNLMEVQIFQGYVENCGELDYNQETTNYNKVTNLDMLMQMTFENNIGQNMNSMNNLNQIDINNYNNFNNNDQANQINQVNQEVNHFSQQNQAYDLNQPSQGFSVPVPTYKSNNYQN